MSSPQTEESRPEVSVVIPAYRVAAYVGDAVKSIVTQAPASVEIIVVNDGSPDTADLERALAPYRDRIVYIKQQNGGVSSARNTGILAARGEWLAFLDADDEWLPGYLESQQNFLRNNPTFDMVFTNGLIFGDTHLAGRTTMEFSPIEGEITLLRALAGECPIGYCALVRRELVVRAGMFDTSLHGSEDYNLWLRILHLGGRIGWQATPLMKYRKRDDSATSDLVWMNERILESLQKTQDTLRLSQEELQALERHRRKIQIEIATLQGRAALQKGDWRSSISHYEQAEKLSPSAKLRVLILLLRICPRLIHAVLHRR